MTSERLDEMFEDMCAKIALVSMGGRAEIQHEERRNNMRINFSKRPYFMIITKWFPKYYSPKWLPTYFCKIIFHAPLWITVVFLMFPIFRSPAYNLKGHPAPKLINYDTKNAIIQSKMYLSSVCVNVEHLGVLSAIFPPLYITNADIMFSEGISKTYKL